MSRYEALRTYAEERAVPESRSGLVVLLRQGVAAWMEAWGWLSAPPSSRARGKHQHQRTPFLPGDASAELVRVLAAMTLGHIQEVQT